MIRPEVRFTGIHGTMMRDAPWVKPDSPLLALFARYNLLPLTPDDPFCWSGDVDGWQFWRRLGLGAGGGDRNDWDAGGSSLRWKLEPHPFAKRGLIVHSHGLWSAIEAMAQGLQIPWMISVGSPVRADMEPRIRLALKNLGSWLHIYDPRCDWWGTLGSFGDGKINWNRAQKFAGPPHESPAPWRYMTMMARRGGNDPIIGIGHSGVLTDPDDFKYWEDRRWLDFVLPAAS